MNHLETLVAEWLSYKGYFVRSAVKVGKRLKGGWDGELDIVGIHPGRRHFLHVECGIDADNWADRDTKFRRKFLIGQKHAKEVLSGIVLHNDSLDQVVVHGYAPGANNHRRSGDGRLITSEELGTRI